MVGKETWEDSREPSQPGARGERGGEAEGEAKAWQAWQKRSESRTRREYADVAVKCYTVWRLLYMGADRLDGLKTKWLVSLVWRCERRGLCLEDECVNITDGTNRHLDGEHPRRQ